ncbi:MAG: hypothetical protein JSU80_00700 [Deltaproteobacteria bacterium]|nr:MAG: hypothetical protein JSU80_00700 [Deltaproteobacteria bacterium]
MSDTSKDKNSATLGAFYARVEDGQLVMEPYCSCGNQLDEYYHCDKCNKHSRCTDILCEDQATLNLVEKYIRTSPRLRNFNAMLGKRKATED